MDLSQAIDMITQASAMKSSRYHYYHGKVKEVEVVALTSLLSFLVRVSLAFVLPIRLHLQEA